MRRHADPVRSCSEALTAPLLLPVIYLTFISLMVLALLTASAFSPNALREAEGRMRLEAALDWEPYAPGDPCVPGRCARLELMNDLLHVDY